MFPGKVEVKTFKIKAFCNECYVGEMVSTGEMLAVHPPKYPHKCNHCGRVENLDEVYPYLYTEEVE
jgi:hypothetical protein